MKTTASKTASKNIAQIASEASQAVNEQVTVAEAPIASETPKKTKQYHVAIAESSKTFIWETKAKFSAPSVSKPGGMEMSEREFVDAMVALCEANPDLLAKECERTLSLRTTRVRKSASVAEVEALKAKNAKAIEKLTAMGLTEEQIQEILG